ncbi:KR domain-containing protein, partial [Streptomyces sp. NPDC016640]|uniref:KR domain-containing protein n=1 Tax=Streptomyces sp. NPDC016640 TaxID=3364969 RepID=UPI0036F9F266
VRSFTAAVAVRSEPSAPTDELALFFHLAPQVCQASDGDRAAALREIAGKVTREIGVSPSFLIPVQADAVPKTEIGKIQRTKLRKSFEAGAYDEEVRATQLLLGTAATVPDWFLRPVWQHAQTHRPAPVTTARHTLLLAGGDPHVHHLADRLAHALRADGGLCTVVIDGAQYTRLDAAHYRIRPTEETDHTALLRQLESDGRPVDAVLHLDGLSTVKAPEAAPTSDTGTVRLLALARALAARSGRPRPVDLLHVTAGAQAVRPGDRPSPAHAMAGALLKSLNEELRWLRGTHLDLAAHEDSDPLPTLLTETATAPCPDTEVALRDGRRYVRRLAPLPDTPPRTPTPAPAPDGFTLLTGGLGGVGTEVATHLLRTPGTRLLILGRTPLPAEDTWQGHLAAGGPLAARIEAYRRLRELGEVRYACADVTDEQQVRETVDAATGHWGTPLVSVLHLAGALVERPVGDLDTATWRRALEAKVD